MSPTAGVLNSSLNLPVEEPLSHTLTIAVMSNGNFLRPCKSTERPVPPPSTTTFYSFIPHN